MAMSFVILPIALHVPVQGYEKGMHLKTMSTLCKHLANTNTNKRCARPTDSTFCFCRFSIRCQNMTILCLLPRQLKLKKCPGVFLKAFHPQSILQHVLEKARLSTGCRLVDVPIGMNKLAIPWGLCCFSRTVGHGKLCEFGTGPIAGWIPRTIKHIIEKYKFLCSGYHSKFTKYCTCHENWLCNLSATSPNTAPATKTVLVFYSTIPCLNILLLYYSLSLRCRSNIGSFLTKLPFIMLWV